MTRVNRRAFTFPELVIGMAVTVLCLGAMSSVMLAVSAGWKQQGKSQTRYLADRQAVVRIQNIIRDAKMIGLVREGSLATNSSDAACVVLWKSDTSGKGNLDRKIQFSEIGVLQHDRSTKQIKYHYVSYPSNISNGAYNAAENNFKYTDLTAANAPEDFKALTYVTSQVIANNVTAATFYSNQTLGQSTQLPTFEFQLNITRNGNTSQVYGSAALRTPDFKPSLVN